jgi:hypothetical protein
VTGRPTGAELLETPGALLTRSHLRELGLGRAAIDAIFRALDVIVFPGSSRPHVRREDYLELIEASTYDDGRVRRIGLDSTRAPRVSARTAPRKRRPPGLDRPA